MAKLIIIGAVCILSSTLSQAAFNKEEALKDFMNQMEACKGQVGASEADMEEMMKQVSASSKEGKCLRACVMKHYGVDYEAEYCQFVDKDLNLRHGLAMDDGGKFVRSVAMKHGEDYFSGDADKLKVANEMLDACADIAVPADNCDAAETYAKCFVEQGKAHGIDKFKFDRL